MKLAGHRLRIKIHSFEDGREEVFQGFSVACLEGEYHRCGPPMVVLAHATGRFRGVGKVQHVLLS